MKRPSTCSSRCSLARALLWTVPLLHCQHDARCSPAHARRGPCRPRAEAPAIRSDPRCAPFAAVPGRRGQRRHRRAWWFVRDQIAPSWTIAPPRGFRQPQCHCTTPHAACDVPPPSSLGITAYRGVPTLARLWPLLFASPGSAAELQQLDDFAVSLPSRACMPPLSLSPSLSLSLSLPPSLPLSLSGRRAMRP